MNVSTIAKTTFLATLVLVLGVVVYLGISMFETTPPELALTTEPTAIGQQTPITIRASDKGSGLEILRLDVIQDGNTYTISTKEFPGSWWGGTGFKAAEETWDIKPKELGLVQGKAVLRASARDGSLWDGLRGNEKVRDLEVMIDYTPPTITLAGSVHNIESGGAGCVAYRLGEPVAGTGVRLGGRFFPGSPTANPGMYVTLFAIPFDVTKIDSLVVEAVDMAGNISRTAIPHRLKYKRPKVDRINITDGFLASKMPEFTSRHPELTGNPMEIFLRINSEMRRKNNAEIQAVTQKGLPEKLWEGAFLALPNAKCFAGFPDERHYIYNGREIDQAHHLGIDLAVLEHTPVPAANSGIVAYTGYIGIYGNTVIMDHGMGLFSLYAHLSEIRCEKGERRARGDIIGLTGKTGLAGGDHLHFSMLVHGEFVTPVEWWDEHWIRDHVTAHLEAR